MSMKIKVEKVLEKGEPRIKILEMEGLSYYELPSEYVAKPPNVRFYSDNLYLDMGKFTYRYLIDGLLTQQEFENLMRDLNICGTRLKEINDKIRELKKTWNGVKEYKI